MKEFRRITFLILIVFLFVLVTACRQKGLEQSNIQESGSYAKPVTLTVSAASSLTDAMEEIKEAYANEKPHVTITYNFGASGALQGQIEQGAEVDVFLSAATKQMDALVDKGLIMEGTRKNLLENKVVLVVPIEASNSITDFKDLSTDQVKKIGIGEPGSVPVGQYAEEVLKNLGILESIKSKVVYGKDVRQVLTWVETGNVDGGIVYETDAKISKKVKIVAKAPEGSHKPVYYPVAVIKESKNPDDAKYFINFLYSSKAKLIFEKYGFAFVENN